ncbi:sensor histidine kinase [Streptodolium elevatio]|uniref:histidine kinase n=1 Tax=Streptodolium elevatio TaxID=3157996 RepID=A0ABV3DB34_9ACTN
MIETTASAGTGFDAAKPDAESRRGGFHRELSYLLVGFPLAVGTFVAIVTGLSFGIGCAAVVFGLPLLVRTLHAARSFAAAERRRVEHLTGRPLPPHHYQDVQGQTTLARWFGALSDRQAWRDVLHVLVAFPLRLVGFCFAVTWVVGGIGEVLYGAWSWSIPRDDGTRGLVDLMTGIEARWADIAFNMVVGVVLLATAVPVVRAFAALQVSLSRALLTNEKQALRARAETLDAGRRGAVAAEAQTLRRLERDLHDGPQQRLVRLTMDLEAVARRLDSDDPDRARPLVDDMLTQTHEALGEIRALSRGIAPPVLADRGLVAALAAAAARCPVPVTLDTRFDERRRFAPVVENTAYFVVTEALTNVAKHAGAGACTVTVTVDGTVLRAEVRDDGHGGAHLGKGHGLAGLADRLAAVEGTMDLVSPVGGPTMLTASIPLRGVGEGEGPHHGGGGDEARG